MTALCFQPVQIMAFPKREAPIELRLSSLRDRLKILRQTPAGEAAFVGAFRTPRKVYQFRWVSPANPPKPQGKPLTIGELVRTTVKWFSEKLPPDLQPTEDRLLSCTKVKSVPDEAGFYMWILEFRVNDKSFSTGANYENTMFILIWADGTVATEITMRDGE